MRLGASFFVACWLGGGWGCLFFWEKQLAALRHLFPGRKDTPTPYRRATPIGRLERQKRRNEKKELVVETVLMPPWFQTCSVKRTALIFSVREPVKSARRGVVGRFSAGKRCLSAASYFSKENLPATPQARPSTTSLQRKNPPKSRPAQKTPAGPKSHSGCKHRRGWFSFRSFRWPQQYPHRHRCTMTPHRASDHAASVR